MPFFSFLPKSVVENENENEKENAKLLTTTHSHIYSYTSLMTFSFFSFQYKFVTKSAGRTSYRIRSRKTRSLKDIITKTEKSHQGII